MVLHSMYFMCLQTLYKLYITYLYATSLSILYSWDVCMLINVNLLLFNCCTAFHGRTIPRLMFTTFCWWIFGLFPISCCHKQYKEHSYTYLLMQMWKSISRKFTWVWDCWDIGNAHLQCFWTLPNKYPRRIWAFLPLTSLSTLMLTFKGVASFNWCIFP